MGSGGVVVAGSVGGGGLRADTGGQAATVIVLSGGHERLRCIGGDGRAAVDGVGRWWRSMVMDRRWRTHRLSDP